MCNIIINTYVKSIDIDVTHRKIFTLSKLLVIFILLNMANLLLIINFSNILRAHISKSKRCFNMHSSEDLM